MGESLRLGGGSIHDGARQEDGFMLSRGVSERYRCPASFLDFDLRGELSSDEGYFRFGDNAICYGQSFSGTRQRSPEAILYDELQDIVVEGRKLKLQFDPSRTIDNLRLERYPRTALSGYESALKKLYYQLRPFTSQWLRKKIQRFHARRWKNRAFPQW